MLVEVYLETCSCNSILQQTSWLKRENFIWVQAKIEGSGALASGPGPQAGSTASGPRHWQIVEIWAQAPGPGILLGS
jgi:hypothetical protein